MYPTLAFHTLHKCLVYTHNLHIPLSVSYKEQLSLLLTLTVMSLLLMHLVLANPALCFIWIESSVTLVSTGLDISFSWFRDLPYLCRLGKKLVLSNLALTLASYSRLSQYIAFQQPSRGPFLPTAFLDPSFHLSGAATPVSFFSHFLQTI